MAKPYFPLGMNPDTGDYEGPLDEDSQRMLGARALAWFKKQRYYFHNGKVRRNTPQKDKDGLRNSWGEIPAGAPVFKYDVAEAIRKSIHQGMKPIEALLKHIPASALNPSWLEENGAPSSMIPTSKVYATAKALEAIEKAGILTPEVRAKVLEANGVTEAEMTSAPVLPAAMTEGIEPEIEEESEGELGDLYEEDAELEEIES